MENVNDMWWKRNNLPQMNYRITFCLKFLQIETGPLSFVILLLESGSGRYVIRSVHFVWKHLVLSRLLVFPQPEEIKRVFWNSTDATIQSVLGLGESTRHTIEDLMTSLNLNFVTNRIRPAKKYARSFVRQNSFLHLFFLVDVNRGVVLHVSVITRHWNLQEKASSWREVSDLWATITCSVTRKQEERKTMQVL